MTTASGLIDSCGGPKAVADLMGVRHNTVEVWRSRNKIPRAVWPEMQMAFPAITLPLLLRQEREWEKLEAERARDGAAERAA